jgi:cytochrome c-type biogenesis protein
MRAAGRTGVRLVYRGTNRCRHDGGREPSKPEQGIAVDGSDGKGIGLLSAYALGLGVPFLFAAGFMRVLVQRLGVLRRAGRSLHVVAGAIMVLFGVAMITGQVTAFSYWLLEKFPLLGRIG